jgi:hypothetical protein
MLCSRSVLVGLALHMFFCQGLVEARKPKPAATSKARKRRPKRAKKVKVVEEPQPEPEPEPEPAESQPVEPEEAPPPPAPVPTTPVTGSPLSTSAAATPSAPSTARPGQTGGPVGGGGPSPVRPGTHPMWASFALGPAIDIHEYVTQFKLIQTFGYHFSGTAEGPAVALDLQESFGGGPHGVSVTTIELGPKFVWDFSIVQGLGLYLTPSALLGYAWLGFGCPSDAVGCEDISFSCFDMQLAFEGRLVLADRGLIFFRPFTLDIFVDSDGNTHVRYDLIFGGGAIF